MYFKLIYSILDKKYDIHGHIRDKHLIIIIKNNVLIKAKLTMWQYAI